MEVSPRLERVRMPDTFPRERVVLGELHLKAVLSGPFSVVVSTTCYGDVLSGESTLAQAAFPSHTSPI